MKTVIVIPARFGSSRFPGKPLADICGKTMLQRVIDISREAADQLGGDIEPIVSTEDERIIEHAEQYGAKAILTSDDCVNGTHRVWETVKDLPQQPDVIVNLQGDAPFTPADFVANIIKAFEKPSVEVATVAVQLTWEQLDDLRKQKETSPFSGTTVVMNEAQEALWFSKQILPAIRKEDRSTEKSPVWRHPGLYAYRFDALKQFLDWPEGEYERMEGLEQLRYLENGMKMQIVPVDYAGRPQMSGIDTPTDLLLAEKLIKHHANIAA